MKAARISLLGVAGWLIVAFLYAPLLIAVLYAFSTKPLLTWPFTGWSLEWFGNVLGDRQFRTALWLSLEVAFITAIISTAMGTAASFVFVRRRSLLSESIQSLSRLPVMLPGVFIGVGFVALMIMTSLPPGRFMLMVGHIIVEIPWVILVISSRLRTYDFDIEAAARDLGAGPLQVFFRVTLPIIAPAVIGAALLAFAWSFDETIITTFTAGTDTTVPLYIVSKMRRIIDPSGNAVAVMLLFIPWLTFTLAALALRRNGGLGAVLGQRP